MRLKLHIILYIPFPPIWVFHGKCSSPHQNLSANSNSLCWKVSPNDMTTPLPKRRCQLENHFSRSKTVSLHLFMIPIHERSFWAKNEQIALPTRRSGRSRRAWAGPWQRKLWIWKSYLLALQRKAWTSKAILGIESNYISVCILHAILYLLPCWASQSKHWWDCLPRFTHLSSSSCHGDANQQRGHLAVTARYEDMPLSMSWTHNTCRGFPPNAPLSQDSATL